MRSRAGRSTAILLVLSGLLLSACAPTPSKDKATPLPTSVPKASYATEAQVSGLVAAAPKIRALPAVLTPPLTQPKDQGAATCTNLQPVGPTQSCTYGAASLTKTMVIYGDSHAAQWTYALANVANQAGYKLVRFSLPSCQAPTLHLYSFQVKGPNVECDAFHAAALAQIKQLRPQIIVVSSSSRTPLDGQGKPISAQKWRAGYEKALASLTLPGSKTFLLGDYSYLPLNAADCLAANSTDVQKCSTTRAFQAKNSFREVDRQASTTTHTGYIDTMPWVCSTVCTAVVGGFLVYKDQFHLSAAYTQYLSGNLARALGLA